VVVSLKKRNRIGQIITSLLAVYVGISAGAYIDYYFSGIHVATMNKFITFLLLIVIIVKTLLSKSELKLPGLFQVGLFTTYVLLNGVLTYNEHWFYLCSTVLKIYVFFLLLINLFRKELDWGLFTISFLAISTIVIVIYMYGIISNQLFGIIRLENKDVVINSNTVAYLVLLTIVVAHFYFSDKHKLSSSLMFIVFAVGISIIMILGSRGAFLLSIGIFLLTTWKTKDVKSFIYSLVFIAIASIVVSQVFNEIDYFSERIFETKRFKDEIRFQSTNYAYSFFLESPIWGGNIDNIFSTVTRSMNHLWYLNLLVAYGLVGFMLFTYSTLCIFGMKLLRMSLKYAVFLGFIVVFLLFSPPNMFLSIAMFFLYHERQKLLTKKIDYLMHS
jgi:hypothetical protein